MEPRAFELQDVDYSYPGGVRALQRTSLSIDKGKRIAVLGPNGAGKSTMFLHLNGILKPKSGKVFFRGEEIKYHRSFLTELRRKVGIVFQDPDTQLFAGNVLQEVSFGPMNLGLSNQEIKNRVERALITMGIQDLRDKPIHHLSFGQKKRVSIAGVLAMEPEVIIFDEPTAYLDPKHSEALMKAIDALYVKGKQVILSTHDVNLVHAWADHVFVMINGGLVFEGAPEEVFADRQILEKANLEKPILYEICGVLREKGLFHGATPRTMEAFKSHIKEMYR